MVNARQQRDEGGADPRQVQQGQIRLVQFTAQHTLVDDLLGDLLDPAGGRFGQGAGGGLHRVGEHQDRGFPTAGFGPRIAEVIHLDGLVALRLEGLVIEELHDLGAVVLRDEIDHCPRQTPAPPQFDAVLDVGPDHQRAHVGTQLVMLVAAAAGALIFHKILGLVELTDIVEERTDPHQQGIGIDGPRRSLGQLPHHLAVVEGARRLEGHLLQEGVIQIREFEQG